MNRAVLKFSAKDKLKGKWGQSAITTLIQIAIMSAPAAIPGIGPIIEIIIAPILVYGLIYYNLKTSRLENAEIADLFSGFKNFATTLIAGLLMSIFTALWSLLFIIPGIIASLSYSLTLYILIDNPEMGAMDAIKKSKEMTYGYKWEIFKLYFSFIGWGLLSLFTCGIGTLWLVPYIHVTFSNFYNELKMNQANQSVN